MYIIYRGVTFHSLLVTRWNSVVVRYSLQNSLVTRCKKSRVTRCRSCSLQNSLVTHCRTCSLQKITRCSFQNITGFSLRNSLDTHCEKSFFVKTITRWNYCLFKVNKYKWVKSQQLFALSQRNEKDPIKHPNHFPTCGRWQILK